MILTSPTGVPRRVPTCCGSWPQAWGHKLTATGVIFGRKGKWADLFIFLLALKLTSALTKWCLQRYLIGRYPMVRIWFGPRCSHQGSKAEPQQLSEILRFHRLLIIRLMITLKKESISQNTQLMACLISVLAPCPAWGQCDLFGKCCCFGSENTRTGKTFPVTFKPKRKHSGELCWWLVEGAGCEEGWRKIVLFSLSWWGKPRRINDLFMLDVRQPGSCFKLAPGKWLFFFMHCLFCWKIAMPLGRTEPKNYVFCPSLRRVQHPGQSQHPHHKSREQPPKPVRSCFARAEYWHEGSYLGWMGAGRCSCCWAPWWRGSGGWG